MYTIEIEHDGMTYIIEASLRKGYRATRLDPGEPDSLDIDSVILIDADGEETDVTDEDLPWQVEQEAIERARSCWEDDEADARIDAYECRGDY